MFASSPFSSGTPLRRLALFVALVVSACSDPTNSLLDFSVVTPGDTLFSAVVSGQSHSCALTMGGRAYCWGIGTGGQLGIGSIPVDCPGEIVSVYSLCANVPTPVAGGLRFTRLATGGFDTTCGLTVSGRLYCWGGIPYTFPKSNAPVHIGGSMRFSDLAVRDYVCAIGVDRQTYCWGDNSAGRDGVPIGTTLALDEARPVAGGHVFTTVSTADSQACATTEEGALYCWGGYSDTIRFDPAGVPLQSCPFGRNMGPCTHVPLKMRGADQWSRHVGSEHSCAITTADGVSCWGDAFYEWGSFATGRTESWQVLAASATPIPLVLPTPIRDIVGSPGLYGACAHARDGRVVCWGTSLSGEFGTGVAGEKFNLPTIVAGGRAWAQLSAGNLFMCGLTDGGEILCWGDGSRGALGTGAVIPANGLGRRSVPTPTRIASIAAR